MSQTAISSTDLTAAIRALEAQGLPTTHQAVEQWLAPRRVAQPRAAAAQPSVMEPSRKGVSRLSRFADAPPKTGGKPGRPRIVASWFPAVAETMADGTTLRVALAINGLALGANEIRALYRNTTFKALYQEARRRYLIENWGRSRRPSLRALLGRSL